MSEKKQVLVICRSAAGQMYLGILFNRIWYSPYLAQNANEGVQIAKNSPFSLVILDGDLAENELNEELSLLRTDPSVSILPLIIFVKQNSPEFKEALLSRGCSAVLAKPLDLAQTYEMISNLIGQDRKSPRVPVRFTVEIEEALPERNLTCVNISEGGMFLRTPNPLPEKTIIHVKFTLPLGEGPIRATAVVAAEVVRTAPLEIPVEREPGMGLRFIDIPEQIRMRIREFVQVEMTGDLDEDVAR